MTEEFVRSRDDGSHLLIDGCILLKAYLPENQAVKCHHCQTSAIYHEDFDSYICVYCNEWLEKKCGDAECEYCPSRPDSPLPNENYRRKLRLAHKQEVYPKLGNS